MTRTRNLAGNDHDGWEMEVRSEEDNTNSILDTIYKSPPGLEVSVSGREGRSLILISTDQLSSPSPKPQILGVSIHIKQFQEQRKEPTIAGSLI